MTDYKDVNVTNKERINLGQIDDNGSIEESYKSSFEDLFLNDHDAVLKAIINLANIADHDITIFDDCTAFTKVLHISDDPIFDDYMVALYFFDKIISNSTHNTEFLVRFISPAFLSLLKNFLFTNLENPDFYRLLFNIYGNVIFCSKYFSEEILSSQFLSRLYEIVEHIPKTSDYFLDLLGCILLRYKILMSFSYDPFPKIIEIIKFFFESPDFILFSNVFSTLAQASSITFPEFIKTFFAPFIVEKTFEIIGWQDENNEDMIQIGEYAICRQSFFTLKRDALSIILNFSAIDKETRTQLINIGLIDLNCADICFFKESNDFFETQNKQNELDSSLLPQIVSNFFTDIHSNAIIFAYSTFWKSLINNYEWFNFDTKQEIARAATLALLNHDEDLITTILSEDTIDQVVLAFTECFLDNTIKLEVSLIQAIDNLIGLFCEHPKIKEINLAFTKMIYSELVNEINEFYLNRENEISSSLYQVIERILSFFKNYSNTIFENGSNDKNTENINEFIDELG